MATTFDGKVALVTGAGSGMGRATALAFAAAGAQVIAADVDASGGAETVRLIESASGEGRARFVYVDVSHASAVEAMIATTVATFGRLDCAVNNAAIENEHVAFVDSDDDNFDRIIAVNLRGVYLCMKHEIRQMIEQGTGGTIVNLGSTNSFRPQPNQTAYTASKHAVIGLTRSAAMDHVGDGIRVNAVCPGAIDTPMLRAAMATRGRDPAATAKKLSGLGRFGETSEIANAILWLSSDDSSFTVGHALPIDGGYLSR